MRPNSIATQTWKLNPLRQARESDICEISAPSCEHSSRRRSANAAAVSERRYRFIPTNRRENVPALELPVGTVVDDDRCWVAALEFDASAMKYVLDASGSMTRMNTRGTEYTGRSFEQLQGSGWQSCIHPDDLEVLCSSRAEALGQQRAYTAAYRMSTAAGAWRWVQDRGTPVQYQGKLVWLGILNDVDDIVAAQQQFQERSRCLERSNRDLHHFASVVAHDLQSPLGTIGTMSAWLIEEYGDRLDENAREYLSYMGKAVQRMNTLVTATLQYSRVEADRKQPAEKVDSGEVLAWTLMTLSGEIKQRQAVVTSGRLPKLACSEHTLVHLFQNLIANALRYCAPGSSPRIHVSAIRSAAEWTFSVADNGIGIDSADTERIFELFQRVDNDGGGMGIGLSICRKVIDNLGGRIWVESEPGKGSTFRFTIPR